jgi:hypothetical protein
VCRQSPFSELLIHYDRLRSVKLQECKARVTILIPVSKAWQLIFFSGVAAAVLVSASTPSNAVEYTLGLYALGTGAVGAGQTPPAGVYFTTAFSYSHLESSKDIAFGGTTITAKADLPVFAGNILAVLPDEFLGGHLSVSGTSGVGNILIDASVVGRIAGQKSVQGWGLTDTSLRASLGWEIGPTFSHKISVTQVLPSGRYNTGFYPILGLNRLGTDVSWGATFIEPSNKIELSGTAGFTYEGYNPLALYRSGNAVHFEEGLSKHFDNGFRLGVISYQYVQVSDDSGQGAKLGPFRTRAVAVGPSVGYTTIVGGHLIIFTIQATHEVAARNRLKQTTGLFSTTVKF